MQNAQTHLTTGHMKIFDRWAKEPSSDDQAWLTGKRGFPSRTAVFFVHGFGSTAEKTWLTALKLFLTDNDLSQISFFAYRYPTDKFSWQPWRRLPGLGLLASGLSTEIRLRSSSYNEIIVIAHSMGGLITRKMVVDEISSGKIPQIKRALLLATPNSGSALGSIVATVLPRYKQATALSFLSDEVEHLNDAWINLKVDEKVIFNFVAGGFDQIVSSNSVKSIPGRPLDDALIEYGHSAITQCESFDSSNYILMKQFLLGQSALKSEVSNLVQPNPLFEVYRIEHEQYYKIRDFDKVLANSFASGDVWIWGKSGVGKTACSMRVTALNSSRVLHIYLGSYQLDDADNLVRALAAEIADRIGIDIPTPIELGRVVGSIADGLADLCSTCGMVSLLIEEIPLNDEAQLTKFADLVSNIRDTIEVKGADNFRIIITSIMNPSNFRFKRLSKRKSATAFLEMKMWETDDLIDLASLIDLSNSTSSKMYISEIANAAEGLPRFVKTMFRHITRTSGKLDLPIMDLINQVRQEIV